MRSAALFAVLIVLVFLQVSCEVAEFQQPDPGGTRDRPTAYPPEDLGTWVTMAANSGIAWSADGTEIFHFAAAGTCPPLQAVDIRDGSTRVVTDSVCTPPRLRSSADGTALFYQIFDQVTDNDERSRIYRVPSGGGPAEMLVERILPLYLPWGAIGPTPMNTSFAASADGSAIAYLTTGDSLYVLDVADRSTQVVATGYSGPGGVVAFSPDGTEVVHYREYSGPLAMTSLLDGTTRAISDQWLIRGLRWQDGEIQILHVTAEGHYYVRNVTTGQNSKIAELRDTWRIAWSADGTRVASWVEGGCLASVGDWVMSRCTAWQYVLYLIDTRSQATIRIGQGNFSDARRVSGPEFSPDGNRIAFTVRSRDMHSIFVKELP